MPKEGGKCHKKGDILVLWDASVERSEEQTTSVVSIPKNKFNGKVQGSWRLDVVL